MRLKESFVQISGSCQRAHLCWDRLRGCDDAVQRSLLLDALSMNLLRLGEHVNVVQRMQEGFWDTFGEVHCLELRDLRDDLAHRGELTEERAAAIITQRVPLLASAIENTHFSMTDEPGKGQFQVRAETLRALPAVEAGETASPATSLVGICIGENGGFEIHWYGRTVENELTVARSTAGRMNLTISRVEEPTRAR